MTRRMMSPFRELENMERQFDRLMRRSFGDVCEFPEMHVRTGSSDTDYVPRLDLFKRGDDIVARLELPGVEPEDMDISVTDRVLTVTGTRTYDKEKELVEGEAYCTEHHYGKFERSIVVPEGTTVDGIHADYSQGILTITVPGAAAKVESKKVKIPIEVGEPKAIEEPSADTAGD